LALGAGCIKKPKKTVAELGVIVRKEAAQMLGPWPRGMDMLISTIGEDWYATFTVISPVERRYRDLVLTIVADLQEKFAFLEG
jgi:hypothetical protein